MRPIRWLATVIGIFGLIAAVAVASNVYFDIYGIFRDTKNRRLVDYGDDRIAKYLLSERYVPQNFDGILVGPSVSSNWDLHGLQTLDIYNESLNGSNFVEEACLVRNTLSSPGLKVALLVMHPSMTADHDFNTVPLTPRENWGALGSVSLFEAYKDRLGRFRHPERLITDDYGTDFFVDPVQLNGVAAKMLAPGRDFGIDPLAWQAFQDIQAALRKHHVKVVYVFPPTYISLFTPKKEAFERYKALVLKDLRADEASIDFTSDAFGSFWRDRLNFSDGVHISHRGTPKIVALLDGELAALRLRGLL